MSSAEVERIREFKKTVESLTAELANADNLALHSGNDPDVTLEERRKIKKLQNELKQIERDNKKLVEAKAAEEALVKNIELHSKLKPETPEQEGIRLAKLTKELMQKQKEKKTTKHGK